LRTENPISRRSVCYVRQKLDIVNQTWSNLVGWRGQFRPGFVSTGNRDRSSKQFSSASQHRPAAMSLFAVAGELNGCAPFPQRRVSVQSARSAASHQWRMASSWLVPNVSACPSAIATTALSFPQRGCTKP